jgi:hypothetical protein
MGEVWKAMDTKLNREVAIKVIPEVFAQDADRMARFSREAQVLAYLKHQYRCDLWSGRAGPGDGAGQSETLQGPLPAKEPLRSPARSPKPSNRRTKRALYDAPSLSPFCPSRPEAG